ncbi:hypothetical protein SESBI_47003 [Sesbania bispinosa]|nr:hypothetical protein SESBI_47003 [Sesbania bispinosa]
MSMKILTYSLLMVLLMKLGSAQNGCPFRLTCTQNKKMLELPAVPVPVKLLVSDIDYGTRTLEAHDPENCLPRLFLRLNYSSFYPFSGVDYGYGDRNNISFFDCSSVGKRHLRNNYQIQDDAQDMLSCPIYAADDFDGIIDTDLVSCTKLFEFDRVLPVPAYEIQRNSLSLGWSDTNFDRSCFDCKHKSKKKTTSILLATAGVIVGSTVVALLLAAIIRKYRYFRMKGEDHARVENFLKDYRALKPTRFSYADIKRITHQFKEKLGEGAHGAVYKDWIHSLLDGGDIHIPMDEEGDFKIAKKLAIVGLWCIQWHPVHRPSMKTVMQMLQGEGDNLKVPRNPFEPTALTSTSANTASAGRLNLELEVIQELD